MKILRFPTCLLLGAVLSAPAYAGLFTNSFEALIVAERAKGVPDNPGAATGYTALEGGYIEAGDPIAGENPPSADQVRTSLRSALAAAGFQEAGGGSALAITYFWGVLRPDREQIRTPYDVNTNLQARIALVSTQMTGAELNNHILGRKKGGGEDPDASSPPILVGPTETAAQNARHARYFVIVTAFDYASIGPGKTPKMLWQVKASALESSGSMADVIPALLGTASAYLGKSLPQATVVDSSTGRAAPAAGSGEFGSYLDKAAVGTLLHHERVEFSGTTGDSSG
jgi:hypothetical protein